MKILGVSAYYHDSAACLLCDGEIVAAAQEERFSRIKHDASFPRRAIEYCLSESGGSREVDVVAFYEKPFLKADRLLSTYLAAAPAGLRSFLKAAPAAAKEKIWIKQTLREHLQFEGAIVFAEHHESHAASAFFPSPFEDAAIVTADGVGEWATSTIGSGNGNKMELLWELQFPHSLGLLYSAFAYYLGFRVNSGEYKVMGLAPFGQPRFRDLILSELVDLKPDGSLRLNLRYFNFVSGMTMTNARFETLLGVSRREPETLLTQHHFDVARSIQAVTEEAMLRTARHARKTIGSRNLCLAGGVALNCVANSRLLREAGFDRIWIQPAAGDAGGALGAALVAWHCYRGEQRHVNAARDKQRGSLLGPRYDAREFLRSHAIPHRALPDDALMAEVTTALREQKIVGWFDGRAEFGPRALGNRSILADPRSSAMRETLNARIKFRESFRPFAPAVAREKATEYFDLAVASPYMLLTATVKSALPSDATDCTGDVAARLRSVRSAIPAVTHVDNSARLQTVDCEENPRLHRLLQEWEQATGCAVLVNTSFNVRGEPPVCTPEDAYRCFMRTDIDYLVMGNFLIEKQRQEQQAPLPEERTSKSWLSKQLEQIDASDAAVRRFGFLVAAALLVVTAVAAYRRHGVIWSLVAAATALAVSGARVPQLIRPLYRAWMMVSRLLGTVITHLLLTVLYYLIVTPLGLLQRLTGNPALAFAFRCNTASYYKRRANVVGPPKYEQQF